MLYKFILITLFVFGKCYFDFNGYSLYDIKLRNKEDLKLHKKLDEKFPNQLAFIFDRIIPGSHLQIFVSPNVSNVLNKFLSKINVSYNIYRRDWNKYINIIKNERSKDFFDLNKFNSYNKIRSYLKNLSENKSSLVFFNSLGKSYEGREINYLKIGYQNNKEYKRKSIIVIEGGIHGREWSSISSSLYIINKFVKNSKKYEEILKNIDIIVIPLVNPDGYEYSRYIKRFWRGNRNISLNSECGVDINRNFPFKWCKIDSECEENSGVYPGSEIETQNMITFFEKYKNNIKCYLSLHSYGQYILFPWGFKKEPSAAYFRETHKLATKMKRAIQNNCNKIYTIGQVSNIIYSTCGSSTDFAKSLNIKYVYTIELSPSDNEESYKFQMPEKHISEIGEEAFIAVLEACKQVNNEHKLI